LIEEPVMNTNIQSNRTSNHDLTHVIEPLASYICAADQPREALLSALAVLFDEVEGTNRAALLHFSCLRADSLGLAS
jgi:hypothetical protein